MSNKSKVKLTPLFLSVVGLIMVGGVIFYLSSPVNNAEAKIYLNYKDADIVGLGKNVYAKNCASCHGVALGAQANWQQRDSDGYLPAPPHDETGHTWHHDTKMLFDYTKYGGQKTLAAVGVTDYNSGMPGYQDVLSDLQIWEVLAFIRSTWPKEIQDLHATRH